MVVAAWPIALSRAVASEADRQVCSARASGSRITMTDAPLRPAAKLRTQLPYEVRSGAPPADAPPQSRFGISYTTSTGVLPADLAAEVTAETLEVMVLGL